MPCKFGVWGFAPLWNEIARPQTLKRKSRFVEARQMAVLRFVEARQNPELQFVEAHHTSLSVRGCAGGRHNAAALRFVEAR